MDLFDFVQDIGNYEERKVNRTEVSGLIVSTAYTSDQGYETALLDVGDTMPVERYETREAAVVGHARWVEKARTIEKVVKLGWGDIIPSTEVMINRAQ